MKTYEQTARDVLARRDSYTAERSRKIKAVRKYGGIAACVLAAVTAAFALNRSELTGTAPAPVRVSVSAEPTADSPGSFPDGSVCASAEKEGSSPSETTASPHGQTALPAVGQTTRSAARTDAPTVPPRTTVPNTTAPRTTEPRTAEPRTTAPHTTEPRTTAPRTTEPRTTAPPSTEPPSAEPPAAEPPATEPPATEPPATEPPTRHNDAAASTPDERTEPPTVPGESDPGHLFSEEEEPGDYAGASENGWFYICLEDGVWKDAGAAALRSLPESCLIRRENAEIFGSGNVLCDSFAERAEADGTLERYTGGAEPIGSLTASLYRLPDSGEIVMTTDGLEYFIILQKTEP